MKKETTAQRLRKIMDLKHLRQVDVVRLCEPYSEKFGVKIRPNDLCQYLAGRSLPNQKRLSVLGLALGVSEVWLMGIDVPMERPETLKSYRFPSNARPVTPYVKLPTLGTIHAGPPIENASDTNIGEWDYADAEYSEKEHFILNVVGDSMMPTIPDGSEVIIHSQKYAHKGDIVAFGVDVDSATLKRYFPQPDGTVLLRGDNPTAESFIITPAQIENGEATIYGVAVSYKVKL